MLCRIRYVMFLGLVAVLGCDGQGEKVQVYPVHGRIFYNGEPAVGVKVFLFPTTAPGVPQIPANPHGETGPDGRFSITTYSKDDGAAEGSYQVVLFWPSAVEAEDEESDQDKLLGWYTVARSRLTLEVKPGDNEIPPYQLPVMTKPPAESGGGIPGRN